VCFEVIFQSTVVARETVEGKILIFDGWKDEVIANRVFETSIVNLLYLCSSGITD
jgi:hypothetical protein